MFTPFLFCLFEYFFWIFLVFSGFSKYLGVLFVRILFLDFSGFSKYLGVLFIRILFLDFSGFFKIFRRFVCFSEICRRTLSATSRHRSPLNRSFNRGKPILVFVIRPELGRKHIAIQIHGSEEDVRFFPRNPFARNALEIRHPQFGFFRNRRKHPRTVLRNEFWMNREMIFPIQFLRQTGHGAITRNQQFGFVVQPVAVHTMYGFRVADWTVGNIRSPSNWFDGRNLTRFSRSEHRLASRSERNKESEGFGHFQE